MCNEDRDCPWFIGHVPDHFKTQEMCTRAHGHWSISRLVYYAKPNTIMA